MNNKNLSETTLLRRLSEIMSDQIQRHAEITEKGKIIRKTGYIETEKEDYSKSVFLRVMNILSTYEQLEFIPVFIRRFPTSKFYSDNGINHPKYLQYHIENHFLKISTILDQCIILVSEIYRLGIPPKLSSLSHLRENKFTENAKAVKLLREFEKDIQGIKSKRNLIIHRGEFSDNEIDEIGMFFFVSDNLTKDEKDVIPKFFLKYKMKEIVKNKQDFLEKNNIAVYKFLDSLFDNLVIEFNQKFEKL